MTIYFYSLKLCDTNSNLIIENAKIPEWEMVRYRLNEGGLDFRLHN